MEGAQANIWGIIAIIATICGLFGFSLRDIVKWLSQQPKFVWFVKMLAGFVVKALKRVGALIHTGVENFIIALPEILDSAGAFCWKAKPVIVCIVLLLIIAILGIHREEGIVKRVQSDAQLANTEDIFDRRHLGIQDGASDLNAVLERKHIADVEFERLANAANAAIGIDSKNANAYLVLGRAYSLHGGSGDPALALVNFETAIARNNAKHREEPYLYRGIEYAYQEKYDKAVEDFTSALDIEKDCQEAIYMRDLVYILLGQYERIDYDHAASDLKPLLADILYKRGRELASKEFASKTDYKEAIRAFNAAVSIKPDFHEALLARGWASYKMAAYAEAADFFHAALRDKEDYEGFYGLGMAHYNGGKYAEAIEDLRTAWRFSPGSPELLYYYRLACGHVTYSRGQFANAKDLFEAALRIKSDSDEAHYYLGLICYLMDDYGQAKEHLDTVLAAGSDSYEIPYYRGMICYREGQYNLAIQYFDTALKNKSDSYDAWYYTGMAYYYEHEYSLASEAFDAALKLNPESSEARHYSGMVQYFLYGDSAVNEDFDTVLENEAESYAFFFYHGMVYYRGMEDVEAIANFKSAKEINKTHEVCFMLGLAYYRNGNYADALETFNDAKEIENTYKVFYNLGLVYYFMDEYANARDNFASAKAIRSTYEACYHCGMMHALLGEYDKAIENFNAALYNAEYNENAAEYNANIQEALHWAETGNNPLNVSAETITENFFMIIAADYGWDTAATNDTQPTPHPAGP